MKILIMAYTSPPEISARHLYYELSQALSSVGQKVVVMTAFPRRYLVNYILKHDALRNLIVNVCKEFGIR